MDNIILKPSENLSHYDYNEYSIDYLDVHEIVQGGPETGVIQINFERIGTLRFGTNLMFYKKFVITSVYKWSWGFFKKSNFKPCAINLETLELIFLGNPEILFLPKEIKLGELIYFVDLENKIQKSLMLSI